MTTEQRNTRINQLIQQMSKGEITQGERYELYMLQVLRSQAFRKPIPNAKIVRIVKPTVKGNFGP